MKKHSYREYIALKKLIEAIETLDDSPEHCHDNATQEEEVEHFNEQRTHTLGCKYAYSMSHKLGSSC